MNRKCNFCRTPNRYAHLKIANYRYWQVELRDSQVYLGWCLVILQRHVEDICDVKQAEWNELHEIMKRLRRSVIAAWHPDRFNYGFLGNVVHHVHLQFIPRYKRSIEFSGVEFKDKLWGKNYGLYNREFSVTKDVQKAIINKVRSKL